MGLPFCCTVGGLLCIFNAGFCKKQGVEFLYSLSSLPF